ncbi:MAG: hypothetical protein HY842_04320 [Bacteroidetes bacterium]|nr:hypothetical protein [Bacteroidota bacterium]
MKNLLFLSLLVLLFSCQQDPASTNAAENSTPAPAAQPAVNEVVQQLFEEVNVVKMHLFGTNAAEPTAENYPYAGNPVEEAALKFLSHDLQPNEVGSVYACYRTENNNFYVLRVPGKYASSDLVLAKWDAGTSQLVKVIDLASLQCDEGLCHQQDAWLTDLDDDRSLDLVIRKHTSDQRNISEVTFTVLSQQPPGTFGQANDQLASLAIQTNYVMQK